MKLVLALLLLSLPTFTQEPRYFVTYSHHMEEAGNLELAMRNVVGDPHGGHAFVGSATELEYGVNGWWTTEFYLDGQYTAHESATFTGFRWENRFRPLVREHWINPVLYAEFENINSADKSLLEVVGNDARKDLLPRTDRSEKKREAELRLVLSSNLKGWNISENVISEKNLVGDPWEFGYAVGINRPLASRASAKECTICRENFSAGAEMYGGLGTTNSFGLHSTSHYIAPLLSLRTQAGPTFTVSPGFGLNDNSHRFLLRFAIAYEVSQIASKLRGEH